MRALAGQPRTAPAERIIKEGRAINLSPRTRRGVGDLIRTCSSFGHNQFEILTRYQRPILC
jgi:hypothetical protein